MTAWAAAINSPSVTDFSASLQPWHCPSARSLAKAFPKVLTLQPVADARTSDERLHTAFYCVVPELHLR